MKRSEVRSYDEAQVPGFRGGFRSGAGEGQPYIDGVALSRRRVVRRSERGVAVLGDTEPQTSSYDTTLQKNVSSTPLARPRRYRVVGTLRGAFSKGGERQKEIEDWILEQEKHHGDLLSRTEQRVTSRTQRQLDAMVAIVDRFGGNELGIDLSDNLPDADQFHFFRSPKPQVQRRGINLPTHHMGIKVQANRQDTFASAHHELLHAISPTLVYDDNGQLDFYPDNFLTLQGKFRMLYEGLIVLSDMEIRRSHWQNNPLLGHLRFGNPGYRRVIPVANELVKHVADSSGDSYTTVMRGLQKGMFMGEKSALQVIAREVGPDGMKTLADWTGDDISAAFKVARTLHLDGAVSQLRAQYREDLTRAA